MFAICMVRILACIPHLWSYVPICSRIATGCLPCSSTPAQHCTWLCRLCRRPGLEAEVSAVALSVMQAERDVFTARHAGSASSAGCHLQDTVRGTCAADLSQAKVDESDRRLVWCQHQIGWLHISVNDPSVTQTLHCLQWDTMCHGEEPLSREGLDRQEAEVGSTDSPCTAATGQPCATPSHAEIARLPNGMSC